MEVYRTVYGVTGRHKAWSDPWVRPLCEERRGREHRWNWFLVSIFHVENWLVHPVVWSMGAVVLRKNLSKCVISPLMEHGRKAILLIPLPLSLFFSLPCSLYLFLCRQFCFLQDYGPLPSLFSPPFHAPWCLHFIMALHLSTLFGWGVTLRLFFSLGVIVCVYPFRGSGVHICVDDIGGSAQTDCVIFSAGVLFVWYWRSGPRQIWPPCVCADRCE